MAISSSITTALTNLQSQIAAAAPITGAPLATKTAIQLNIDNLLLSLQSALTATSILDTYVAPPDPGLIVAGVLSLSSAATDQSNLSLMRGVVGRVDLNLDNISPEPGNDNDQGL